MSENDPGVIRITKEEATSAHVDDLLKRQMSMRGEPGVTRGHRKKWYYQNWIVLMLAGTLGAVAAWAMIEPFFADRIYFQGPVTNLDPTDSPGDRISDGTREFRLVRTVQGSFEVKGQKIYVLSGAFELGPHGSKRRLDLATFHEHEIVGVYVEFNQGTVSDVCLSDFVVRDPGPQSESRARMTLLQLSSRSRAASMLFFPVVGGMIGLFIGAVDGLICRLPRRALISGGVGLMVGIVGGFISGILGNVAYAPLHNLAMGEMGSGGALGAFGFLLQMTARALAWCVVGIAMGLGQGIALRSYRLLIYGLIGGVVGGLLGGILFDPIDLLLLGADKPSAHWSRLIGLAVIGMSVGGMIGLVELLARDAWLRMTQGPLTGKEFLLFKDVMAIGSSPRSDIYLFNDAQVAKQHALVRSVGDACEIEARDPVAPVLLNSRPVTLARLRHGDNVTIGRTSFIFQRRKG
jgi:hypothetical protein